MSEKTHQVKPLNLTKDELDYLWDVIKREVGDPDVQYGPNRNTVESIHTKIHDLKSNGGGK